MRILWVSQVIPYPPKAGVLIRCYYLLRAVARAHEVDLVAFIQEPFLKTFREERELIKNRVVQMISTIEKLGI